MFCTLYQDAILLHPPQLLPKQQDGTFSGVSVQQGSNVLMVFFNLSIYATSQGEKIWGKRPPGLAWLCCQCSLMAQPDRVEVEVLEVPVLSK